MTRPSARAIRPARFADLAFILRGSRRSLGLISFLSLVTAVSEAFLLAVVVQSVAVMSAGRSELSLSFNGVQTELGIDQLLIAAVLAAGVRFLSAGVVAFTGPLIAARSRERHRRQIFETYLRSDWATQSADGSGRLLQVLSGSVNDANTVLVLLTQALPAFLTLVVLVVVSLVLNSVVTFALLLIAVVIGVILRPVSRRAQGAARSDAAGRTAVAGHVSGVIAAGAEITALGARDGVVTVGRDRIAAAEKSYGQAVGLKRLVSITGQSMAFLLATVGLLVLHLSDADVSFATVGTITVLLLRGAGLAQQVQTAVSQYGSVTPFIEQVRNLIDHYSAHRTQFGSETFPAAQDLVLRDVEYTYPGSSAPAVRASHVVVPHGSAIGVIGPSGSGKSTLIQLILRLREQTHGSITIGGRPIKDIAEGEFSRKVAYVPQAPHLIPGTIADNIRFFRPWVTDDDIRQSSRLAHFESDVDRMPDGFGTRLDSHVDGLSGGQKQRLAIARALTGSPEIMVLDEPTSALDATNEAAILATLRSLRGRTTVIMVTHRTKAVEDADVVLLVESGTVRRLGVDSVLDAVTGTSGGSDVPTQQ